ncbi:MAG TPA: NUDIX hydrolase [Polyangiaceae bacterium]|nr:NUDIX hydrolase [Polyangiaceae bacterium]
MGSPSPRSEPTLVDRTFQLAYFCAYRMMRAYWRVAHPTTHGTQILLFHGDDVLLVKNSYVPYWSAPGGYIASGETGRDAVVRELREEIGFAANPDEVRLLLEVKHEWEGKIDHCQIFGLDVPDRVPVEIDHREVVEASFIPIEQALGLVLFPPLRTVLEDRVRERSRNQTH